MRTKNITKTFTFKRDIGNFFLEGNPRHCAKLCPEQVRAAFHLGKFKKVDFVVTNVKPKQLRGWHIIRLQEENHGSWYCNTTPSGDFFYVSVDQLLAKTFPKNKTVYVCAYA